MRRRQGFAEQGERRFITGLLIGAGLFIAAPAVHAVESVTIGEYAATAAALQTEEAPAVDVGEYNLVATKAGQERPALPQTIGEYALRVEPAQQKLTVSEAPRVEPATVATIGEYAARLRGASELQPVVSPGVDIGEYASSVMTTPVSTPGNATIENFGEYATEEQG